MMKKMLIAALFVAAPAMAEEWKSANFIDAGCSGKMKADTDKHTTECALKCADSGFGIVVDGKFVKFDDGGNKQALAELKKTKKKDHLRANVTGTRTGDSIKVEKVSID